MTFDPPRYTWTATTAYDALAVLRAATKLIDSHAETLEPDTAELFDVKRDTPARINISLDLSALVDRINNQAPSTAEAP